MAILTISVAARQNQPPSQSGYLMIEVNSGDSYVFDSEDFTVNTNPPYLDPEGDDMKSIKIKSTPLKGQLEYNGSPVSIDDEVSKSDLDLGKLVYVSNEDDGGYEDSYGSFVISDVGSSTFTYSAKRIYITSNEVENLAPSQVGDGEAEISIGGEFIFTRDSLTSGLNPPYEDPEGNPAYQLRIDSLPEGGVLLLSGVECYVGQIIDFSDIDLGLLKYKDNSESDPSLNSFDFSISDSVSQQFTS